MRWSSPVRGVPVVVETTTLKVNACGAKNGRPLPVAAEAVGIAPAKLVPTGKRDRSSATSIEPRTPSWALEAAAPLCVEPSQ